MQIIQKYIPINTQRRSGQKLGSVLYITAHDTANDGATAQENVDYYIKSCNDLQASAHAFVDDLGVIECVPLDEKAWHVRYNAGIAPNLPPTLANDHSIGIELCYTTRGNFDALRAYENYVTYIAGLMKTYNLKITDLVAHGTLDPTRRTDPFNALGKLGKTWDNLISDIGRALPTNQTTSMEPTNVDGTPIVQNLIIKSISVTYDRVENGENVQTNNTVTVTITPELLAALALSDATLVTSDFKGTITA